MHSKPLCFANFLAFNVNPSYVAICEEVERQLGVRAIFEEGQSFDQFFRDEVDVGYICGLPYSKFARWEDPPFELLVAPVLNEERAAGHAVYFSDVIVPHDSPAQTFDELNGRTFAYNESMSYSGYRIVEWHLKQLGYGWEFFGAQVCSGAHVSSIEMIANKQADVAAVDSQSLGAAFRLDATLAQRVRVVEMLGPSPHPPVVVGRRVSAELKTKLRHFYLTLHTNLALQPLLAAACIERFVEVDDAYYDIIRDRVDATTIEF